MIDISFEVLDNKETVSVLKTEWQNSLTFPNDDYWDAQFDASQHWVVKLAERKIGYACVSENNTLYNFYITPKYLIQGTAILEAFIKQRAIKKGLIGTNNPICYSLIMHFQKSSEIFGYIFKDMEEVNQEERNVEFRIAEPDELEELVAFQQIALEVSIDDSKDWFRAYIGKWISRDEFFVLKTGDKIIGTLELRTSDLRPQIASLGIIVSQDFRSQGYGSYLLVKGKSIAKSRNIEPICACETENIASLKAIEKSGFRKLHLLVLINL